MSHLLEPLSEAALGAYDLLARRLLPGGTEPDPRFTLANERTFLVWIRTSLAFRAGGIAIVNCNFKLTAGCSLR